jgi:hypothetical protein
MSRLPGIDFHEFFVSSRSILKAYRMDGAQERVSSNRPQKKFIKEEL